MMKLAVALIGVILLISGAVLGAAAVQQPYLDFLQMPRTENEAPQPVNPVDCKAPAAPGVNWRQCDKSESTLHGPQESLAGAVLAGADFSGSYFNGVNMTNSSIDGLNLSSSILFLVNFTGARGIPGGEDVSFYIYTCPNGSASANFHGDAARACEWLPERVGSPPPMDTPADPGQKPPDGPPTPTPTASSPAPEPPDTSPDPNCWQGIVNGDFEITDSWRFQETTYPALYSQEQVHGGNWAVRTGISDPADSLSGFSSARQTITIPANLSPAILSFYIYPQTSESMESPIPGSEMEAMRSRDPRMGDAQWVTIYDDRGQELEQLLSMRSSASTWEYYEFNLAGYAGRSIELYFGVYNNGSDGITALYVDDVSLTSCPDMPPTETATPPAEEEPPQSEEAPTETPVPPTETPVPPTETPVPPTETPTPTPVSEENNPLSISGRLLNGEGAGIPGIVVGLNTGDTAMTDGDGRFSFTNFEPGAYTIFAPPPYDLVYEPPSRMVNIPPPAVDQIFVGSTATPEATP